MKTTLTLLSLLTCGAAFAQPTLTATDITPPLGPSPIIYGTDYITPGPATANFTFNTGPITLGSGAQSQYVVPSSTPYFSSFPTATHSSTALTNPSLYSYQLINNTGLYLLGLGNPAYTTVYTNSERIIALPLSYTNTWTDDWTSTTDYGGTVVVRTATTTGAYNGHGTLVLPWGSFNVLRLEIHEVFTDVSEGIEFAAGEITTVTYYQPGQSGALLTSSIVDIPVLGAPTTSTSVLDPNAAGILDNGALELGFALFPNPTSGATIIRTGADLTGKVRVSVLDLVGREVRQLVVNANGLAQDITVDLSGLPASIYHVQLLTADGRRGSMPLVVE